MKKNDLLKCNICKNVVELVHIGEGTLTCCNKNMQPLETNFPEANNAHFAQVETLDNNQKRVYFNHEMTPDHHIEFIELFSKNEKYITRKYLREDETPEIFLRCYYEEGFIARLYCNRDGVWQTEID